MLSGSTFHSRDLPCRGSSSVPHACVAVVRTNVCNCPQLFNQQIAVCTRTAKRSHCVDVVQKGENVLPWHQMSFHVRQRIVNCKATRAMVVYMCFTGVRTKREFMIEPGIFRVLILERLRVPFSVASRCKCGVALDCRGRDRAACPHSRRIHTRTLERKSLQGSRNDCSMQRKAGRHARRDIPFGFHCFMELSWPQISLCCVSCLLRHWPARELLE